MLDFRPYLLLPLQETNYNAMKHQSVVIRNRATEEVRAQAPVIVSVSRATDIPAFYADRFFRRLEEGYVVWRNQSPNGETIL